MTEREQETIEVMARWLYRYGLNEAEENPTWENLREAHREALLDDAQALTNLKDSKGNKFLGIMAEDQNKPFFRDMPSSLAETQYQDGYKQAQQDMLKAGFTKIEREMK